MDFKNAHVIGLVSDPVEPHLAPGQRTLEREWDDNGIHVVLSRQGSPLQLVPPYILRSIDRIMLGTEGSLKEDSALLLGLDRWRGEGRDSCFNDFFAAKDDAALCGFLRDLLQSLGTWVVGQRNPEAQASSRFTDRFSVSGFEDRLRIARRFPPLGNAAPVFIFPGSIEVVRTLWDHSRLHLADASYSAGTGELDYLNGGKTRLPKEKGLATQTRRDISGHDLRGQATRVSERMEVAPLDQLMLQLRDRTGASLEELLALVAPSAY